MTQLEEYYTLLKEVSAIKEVTLAELEAEVSEADELEILLEDYNYEL